MGPGGISLLGTSFAVSEKSFATAAHITGQSEEGLVLVVPRVQSFLDYQDTSDQNVNVFRAKIEGYDPIHDIAILGADVRIGLPYFIGSSDDAPTGARVVSVGFPHADAGRLVLTQQRSSVGARVLLPVGTVKSKHLVLNVQTRPGTSGSPVFIEEQSQIAAMIIGCYAPLKEGGIRLGNIDPQTLHQTTHAVSAEYIREML